MIKLLRRIFCFNHDWEYEQFILDDEWVGVCRKCGKECVK